MLTAIIFFHIWLFFMYYYCEGFFAFLYLLVLHIVLKIEKKNTESILKSLTFSLKSSLQIQSPKPLKEIKAFFHSSSHETPQIILMFFKRFILI